MAEFVVLFEMSIRTDEIGSQEGVRAEVKIEKGGRKSGENEMKTEKGMGTARGIWIKREEMTEMSGVYGLEYKAGGSGIKKEESGEFGDIETKVKEERKDSGKFRIKTEEEIVKSGTEWARSEQDIDGTVNGRVQRQKSESLAMLSLESISQDGGCRGVDCGSAGKHETDEKDTAPDITEAQEDPGSHKVKPRDPAPKNKSEDS
jgi:hypothetical protein